MIKKIYSFFKILNRIPKDKLLHFAYGYVGFKLLLLVMNPALALCTVAIVAGLKEYADSSGYGNSELLDFVVTVMPGVIHIIITTYV